MLQELTVNQAAHPDGIDELVANQISLFPNPASHSFNITSKQDLEKVQIIDAMGKSVVEFNNPGSSIKVETVGWNKGTYFVRISLNNTVIDGTVLIQ